MRYAALLALLALLAAGCGARSSTPFTAKGTTPCLRDKGYRVTTSPKKIGFIAAFAENGGLQARGKSGNVVTIAFTKDTSSVADIERAYRRSAPRKLRPHLSDVMRSDRNAVLVWTVTPSGADSSTVTGCLSP